MFVLAAVSEMAVTAARVESVFPRKYMLVVLSNAGSAALRVTLTRCVGEIGAGPKVPVKAAGALTVYEPPVYATSFGPTAVSEKRFVPALARSEIRTWKASGVNVLLRTVPMLTVILIVSNTGPAGSRWIVRNCPGMTGPEVVPVKGIASTASDLVVFTPPVPLSVSVTMPGARALTEGPEAAGSAIVSSAELNDGTVDAGRAVMTFLAASL